LVLQLVLAINAKLIGFGLRKILHRSKGLAFFAIMNYCHRELTALWRLLLKRQVAVQLSIRHGLLLSVAWHYRKKTK